MSARQAAHFRVGIARTLSLMTGRFLCVRYDGGFDKPLATGFPRLLLGSGFPVPGNLANLHIHKAN
jgi:hypothetical protein